MTKEIEYTDAPKEVDESIDRSIEIKRFVPTPEVVREMVNRRRKKPISIYLTVDTIEAFKRVAESEGTKYQTVISNVLDSYKEQYIKNAAGR